MIRPGRRHALASVLLGITTFAMGATRPAAAKKKPKAKPKPKVCPTCPAPTTCPPPNTCPKRACCVCDGSAPTTGCVLGGAASTPTEADAVCVQVCGSVANLVNSTIANGNNAVFCNTAHSACVVVGCPV